MALINFKHIDCEKTIDKTNITINFNGSDIQIVKYLSANDKYDLIMITLQKAFEKNIYNPFKMDIYFDLNMIYLYTNIIFDNNDREDEIQLYDTLKRSGLIDAVKAEIDENELNYLKECVVNTANIITKYRNTFGSVVSSFIEFLPQNMDKMKSTLDAFDMEKIKEMVALTRDHQNKLDTE